MMNITWKQIKILISKFDKTKKYYGVPRGGQYIAALLNPVDTPEEADVIIDDLIDSGATMQRYSISHPDKQFLALIDKREKEWAGQWLVFPWEVNEQPVEDNIKRIFEYIG
ncbi:MAG: phosphoribosyltransferase, partial [Saprospiraceae bacterium]|nr:phosphoribosyltransferase [Saprospiraceae bacterium]